MKDKNKAIIETSSAAVLRRHPAYDSMNTVRSNALVGAGVGAGLLGLEGLINPGYNLENITDEEGRVIGVRKVRRNRIGRGLMQGFGGGMAGGFVGGSYGALLGKNNLRRSTQIPLSLEAIQQWGRDQIPF